MEVDLRKVAEAIVLTYDPLLQDDELDSAITALIKVDPNIWLSGLPAMGASGGRQDFVKEITQARNFSLVDSITQS